MSRLKQLFVHGLVLAGFLAFGALQFFAGYTYGWNQAPAPSTEYVPQPYPVEVGPQWGFVTKVCVFADGTVKQDPESMDGAMYVVTLSARGLPGYSEHILYLPFTEEATMVMTLRCQYAESMIQVEKIDGVQPNLPKPEPEDDGGEDGADDF